MDVRVFSFSIIVSLDYLMKIKDFLDYGSNAATQAALQSSQKVQNEVSVKKKTNQVPVTNVAPPALMMTINIHVEKQDIIVREDMDDVDSNCIGLNVNHYV